MKIPTRCNKRCCQARRNLTKRPEEYKRWPTCHVPECAGKMYVDTYRLRRGAYDNAPVCRNPNCDYLKNRLMNGDSWVPFHRVSTEGCIHYEEYQLERAWICSKHRPYKESEECPF